MVHTTQWDYSMIPGGTVMHVPSMVQSFLAPRHELWSHLEHVNGANQKLRFNIKISIKISERCLNFKTPLSISSSLWCPALLMALTSKKDYSIKITTLSWRSWKYYWVIWSQAKEETNQESHKVSTNLQFQPVPCSLEDSAFWAPGNKCLSESP